jgi:tetratricopeptide (TPR) repeat protein
MSGGSHYERYKDALKRGHVASLRGRLEDALTAYAEAADIAPERSTPHASAGTALLRRRRPADALRHYAVALRLAPGDEAALLGRAQALAALDQRAEAADAYDALAEARAASGSLSDAVDAARRALELAEGRERRRMLERLIEQLRTTEPDEPGRAALERALQVLDGVAVTPPAQPAAAAPAAASGVTSARGAAAADEAGPAIRAVLDRDLPAGLDSDDLIRSAEVALDAGDPATALGRLLDLAAYHRRAGHAEAALDALYEGLTFAHADAGLHLALVALYGDRGWTALADEKLSLLGRLAALEGDEATLARVTAAGGARG